jgi:lipoic acid synthetase
VVVTSVNRDDLPDEGANHFVEVNRALKAISENIVIEILTPDFRRTQKEAVATILAEDPDIFNHNVETVPSLYRRVRPQGDYPRSLQLFREIRSAGGRTLIKSGLMLGLGETKAEVLAALADLRAAGVDIVTLGQYLQSAATGLPVTEYVSPAAFEEYKQEALRMGFPWVESAPYVRSSFHAKASFDSLKASIEARKSAIAEKA